jgi:hypothetical protein
MQNLVKLSVRAKPLDAGTYPVENICFAYRVYVACKCVNGHTLAVCGMVKWGLLDGQLLGRTELIIRQRRKKNGRTKNRKKTTIEL